MSNHPHSIGPENFELWTGRIELEPSLGAAAVQAIVTDYVMESGISVVGYHTQEPPAFTMLRWPDGREGYQAPTPQACDIAIAALATRMGSDCFTTGVVPDNKLHVMMGRKKGGYGNGEVVPLDELQAQLPDCTIAGGYMVSARTTRNGVESYGVGDDEQVGAIITDLSREPDIHRLGDLLEQHHYAIERGAHDGQTGETTFWETRWSPTYVGR